MLDLTKEQWAEWRSHPVTEHFFEMVKVRREEELERLAFGVYADNVHRQNIAVGAVGAYTHVMNVTFEE